MTEATIKDFVRNHDLLKEDYRVANGFVAFGHNNIEKRVYALNRTSVLAVVGPYGSGKSTELDRIRRSLDAEEVKWLQFDAWRYPERRGLWDGLVIEIAKQLGKARQAARKVDGHSSLIGKWGGVIPEILNGFMSIVPKGIVQKLEDKFGASDAVDTLDQNEKEVAKTGQVAAKISDNLFNRSPAKRVYEFERVLTDMLLAVKQSKIVIVVEDIDRSGTDGINFLETLSFFLSNSLRLKDKTIIAIAPISEISYRENLEAYLKCVDYVEQFKPRMLHMDNFIEEVFGINMHPDQSMALEGTTIPLPLPSQQVKDFLEGLFVEFGSQMNMRKLKLIIREASSNYKLQQADGYNADWRITLCVQAMKYLKDPTRPKDASCYDLFIADGSVGRKSYFARHLTALVDNRRANDDPVRGPVIDANYHPAKGEDVVIDYEFSEGSMPAWKKSTNPISQETKLYLYIQGYYFQY